MRMLILVIAAAIVGLLAARQLTGPPAAPTSTDAGTPAVPERPQDVEGFERDMDRFMDESAAARRDALEQQTR